MTRQENMIGKFCQNASYDIYEEDDITTVFRFDTTVLIGDKTLVSIPTRFASHEVARYELFKILTEA